MGMVKETDEGGILILEDKTGEIEIEIEEKQSLAEVVQDEVLVVSCENTTGSTVGKRIIFPDLPMKRDINKAKNIINIYRKISSIIF